MKRTLLFLLSLLLLLTTVTAIPASAEAGETLRDVQGTRYEAAVRRLGLLNVMSGYPDGTFLPEKAVTRAEMSKIVARLLGVTELPQPAARFADVPLTAWYAPYVEAAYRAGITKGYEDGTFKPDNPITYPEVVMMLLRAAHREGEAVGPWPQSATDLGTRLGILEGTNYTPAGKASRGEVTLLADAVARKVIDPTTGATLLKGLNVAPPVARASAGLPSAQWYRTSVPVVCEGTASTGPIVSAVASPVLLTRDGAGQTATCTVTDEFGQTATATTGLINIDRAAPRSTLKVTPADSKVAPVGLVIQAEDLLSGVAASEYSLDAGKTWLTYTGPVTLGKPGSYQLAVRSRDVAGNMELAKAATPLQLLDENAPVTAGGITLLTRKTKAGYLHYTSGITTAQVESLVTLMDHVYPVVQQLFGIKVLDDVVLMHMYIWEDSLFTVENLNAFSGGSWSPVNVVNGGGALQYGPQRGVYFRLNRITQYGNIDAVGTLAHEYGHIVQHHISKRRPIPAWLDEGMAENVRLIVVRQSISGSAALQSMTQWKSWVSQNSTRLLTLKEMESWFTIPGDRMLLAYNQSALTIRRLIGPEPTMGRLIQVLERIGGGASLADAWKAEMGTEWEPAIQAAAETLLQAEFNP